MKSRQHRYRPTRRLVILGSLLFFALALALPFAHHAVAPVFAQQAPAVAKDNLNVVPNPGAALWRDVRKGSRGITRAPGGEAGVLINDSGEAWRKLRNGRIRTYGGWGLFFVLVAILVYHVASGGGIKLQGGRSGRTIERWSMFNRVVHWYIAILFLILALTGFSLMFGRAIMIPLMGKEVFGAYAAFGKMLHNYLGPFFFAGVLVMIASVMRHNLPEKTDLEWLAQGGGYLGGGHPHCGRNNAGEKILTYWVFATVGIVVCVTGIVLNFPNFEQTRETMQLNTIIHGIAALVWMFFVFGHMYLGSVGVEGALDGMITGHVDENWAKEHHDLWYEEVKTKSEGAGGEADAGSAGSSGIRGSAT
jgi:formate dehydrogenase subunit gamma